jgi:hypothetical protein
VTAAAARNVFVVEGLASAQLPLRLLNYFAQQDLLPEAVDLRRSPLGIAMRIVDASLDERRAAIVLAKMRALPDVASALLEPC